MRTESRTGMFNYCPTSDHSSDRYSSSFEIDGVTYHVLPNENDGKDTLHGGPDGWDWVIFLNTVRYPNAYPK